MFWALLGLYLDRTAEEMNREKEGGGEMARSKGLQVRVEQCVVQQASAVRTVDLHVSTVFESGKSIHKFTGEKHSTDVWLLLLANVFSIARALPFKV